MSRDELLLAARRELALHDFSTFSEPTPKAATGVIIVPGCPRKKRLNTVRQFVEHLYDVLPGIVDLIVGSGREPGIETEGLES